MTAHNETPTSRALSTYGLSVTRQAWDLLGRNVSVAWLVPCGKCGCPLLLEFRKTEVVCLHCGLPSGPLLPNYCEREPAQILANMCDLAAEWEGVHE